jgi:IS30 family transposase
MCRKGVYYGITPDQEKYAIENKHLPCNQIAKNLKVSQSTLYRHLKRMQKVDKKEGKFFNEKEFFRHYAW